MYIIVSIFSHSSFNVLKHHEALCDGKQCGVNLRCHPGDCHGRI